MFFCRIWLAKVNTSMNVHRENPPPEWAQLEQLQELLVTLLVECIQMHQAPSKCIVPSINILVNGFDLRVNTRVGNEHRCPNTNKHSARAGVWIKPTVGTQTQAQRAPHPNMSTSTTWTHVQGHEIRSSRVRIIHDDYIWALYIVILHDHHIRNIVIVMHMCMYTYIYIYIYI